jgi:hypothetical protein
VSPAQPPFARRASNRSVTPGRPGSTGRRPIPPFRARSSQGAWVAQATFWLLVIALLLFFGFPKGDDGARPRAKVVGREQRLFDWTRDACEPLDIPDAPARAFRDASGRVQLVVTHYVNRRWTGRSLNDAAHRCDVIMASGLDPDPAKFNDHEWIGAPYTRDGRTVYALVHNEYQGHAYPGMCKTGDYKKCWYNTITLAVSDDGGKSYTQRPPPAHLVASEPYPYEPDAGPYGIFQPSNIVKHEDGHYYSLVHAGRFRDQPGGVCVMRTRDLADPASWRAWNGAEFSVKLANPYAAPVEDPRDHVCRVLSPDRIAAMTSSLTYSTYYDKFMLVGAANLFHPTRARETGGVYFALSDDLVSWSTPKLIEEVEVPWTFRCGDRNPILYPSVLDPESPSRNFETTGRTAYLYFTRFNYQACQQGLDRDLVRIRIEFSK